MKIEKFESDEQKVALLRESKYEPPYHCSSSYCKREISLDEIAMMCKEGIFCEVCSIMYFIEKDVDDEERIEVFSAQKQK